MSTFGSLSNLTSDDLTTNKKNSTTSSNLNTAKNSVSGNSTDTCVMPVCPSGKVCIQVCPESLPKK